MFERLHFAFLKAAMASRRREFTTDDDPWRVSAFTSALLELLLSLLLLLGAAIAFITFQLVKYFGLDPPCTYIGCSHPLLPHSSKRRRYSVHCHRHTKVDHLSELFPDCRDSWRYLKLQPQSEEFLSINDDTDESLLSEKTESISRHSTAVTSDSDIWHGHLNENHSGSDDNQSVNCSTPIYIKPTLPKYIKTKASVFYGDGKQSAKEECIPLFSTKSISACSSDFDVDKECSPSSDDFRKPSFQKENLQREILTDSDASISRGNKHEHYYMLLEGEEPSRREYVKQTAAIFSDDGTQTAREELVPLYSTRSVSACGSNSDAEDDCQMASTSTDHLKEPSSPQEKLQRGTLIDTDASISRETHHYMLLDDEECIGDGMQSAKGECVLLFRRSVYVRDSNSDAEDDCEMSSTSTDDFKKLSLQKGKLEGETGNASISRDTEHEHHYMLLEDEDEELPTESAQPLLLECISDSELEAPKISTSDLGIKVANVVVVPDSQQSSDIEQGAENCSQCEWIIDSRETTCISSRNLPSGLAEGQNTGPLFIPLKVPAISESIVDDERVNLWDKVQINTGFLANETSTEYIQGFENINPGNLEGIMVEDQFGEDGIFKVEVLKDPFEGLLNIHVLEKEGGDSNGSSSPIELEFIVPKDPFKVHKVQEITAFECGSEIALEDQLQVQEHVDEYESVPVKPFTAGSDTEISLHGEDANEVSIPSDLQQIHECVFSNRGIDEGCSILDNCVQETESKSDGEAILRASLEVVIHEAMDQYLISFKGCVSEDKCASSSDNIDVHVGQIEVAKGNSLEDMEKPCHHAAFQTKEPNSKFEQGELLLKGSCEGFQGNTAANGSCTEELKINRSLDIREGERGIQKHVVSSAQMIVQSQVMNVKQDKEDTLLEEDQEEGLDALREALRAERMTLAALETELENERNAAAIATSEAMAMISRLQEEKSAMQMEVVQLQRMSEEKADYDEQAMELLKEILLKREKEKHALEKEVELYRERLHAEKVNMLKKISVEKSNKDVSGPALTPVLLLRGTDEDHESLSPEGQNDRLKMLPSLEAFYDAGITSFPHVTSMGQNVACREHFGFGPQPLELKETKVSRVDQVGTCFQEDKGNLAEPFINGFHNIHQEPRGTNRSIFSTNDEETQFILERLWVLEEELRELRGDNGLGAPLEAQHGDGSPMKRESDRSCADSRDARCMNGEMGEHKDEDGAGMFLPIHDVYEVQSTPNHPGQGAQQSDTLECSENMLKDFESFPKDISQEYVAASRHNHRPPNIPQARILFPSKEAHCDTALAFNQDYPCADDTHKQWLKATEGRLVTTEVIQQLGARLQVLETDRELLREILESFRHRDAEIKLLQEIARYLRELPMVGPGRAGPGGVLQVPFLRTFDQVLLFQPHLRLPMELFDVS